MSEDDLKTDKASAEDVSKAEPMRWNLIDWEKVERHVNGLQTKIAQAQSEGKKEQVRKLQRLLVHSRDARLLAVRRVTSSKGKNTPGVDGALWNTPAKKLKAALSLTDKGYKAQPLRRVNIPEKGKKGKTRPRESRPCTTVPCRRYTRSHSSPWRRSRRTGTRTGSERAEARKTPARSCSTCYRRKKAPDG